MTLSGANAIFNGSIYVAGTMYDNANTSYYVKASGTSVQYQLTNAGVLGSNGSNARNHFTQYNSGSSDIGTGWISGAFGDANANRIVIGQWTNGSIISAHNGALSSWADLNIGGAANINFWPNNASGVYPGHGSASAYLNSSGNFYLAGTYYDNSNTGYYVKPSSTSNLSALNVGGYAVLTTGAYDTVSNDYSYTHAQITGDTGDFSQSAFSYRSATGSISTTSNSPFGNAWYTYINTRHRGGSGDGTSWGSQIAIGMTSYTNRMAFRDMYSGTWQSWNEVVTYNNNVNNSPLYFSTHYDTNNTGYYVLPSGLSNLCNISATQGIQTIYNANGSNYNETIRSPRAGDGYVCWAMACDTSGSGSISGQYNQIVYPSGTSNNNAGTGAFTIRANGTDAFGISTGGTVFAFTSFNCNNNITAYYSSDRRLKENIRNIESPLEKVMRLNGVHFDWTDDYLEKEGGVDGYFVRKEDVGVIAQEVQEVLPEVVAEKQNGMLGVRYEKLVPLLIEAIKEQQKQIEELRDIINGKSK